MTSATETSERALLSSDRRAILERRDGLREWNPRQLLGLRPDADARSAKAAFLELAKRFHPDSLDPSESDLRDKAQALFMQISSAYEAVRSDLARQPVPQAAPPRPASASERRAAPAVVRSRRREVEDALDEAQQSLREGDAAGAVDALHAVLRLAGPDQRVRVRLLLAAAYLSLPERRRNALSILSEIVREEPANAEALTLLGSLYFREGLLARAESTLARALAADPGNLQARATLRAVRDTVQRRSAPSARPPQAGGLVDRLLLMVR